MEIKDIFTQERISEVIEEMIKKGGESGPDGISVHDLSEYIERNSIVESLLDGSYKPCAAVSFELQTNSGKKRKIYKMSNVDRLILKVLNRGLSDPIGAMLYDNCISYRKGFGIADCCNYIRKALDTGCEYAVKIDIENYFDNIDTGVILNMLSPLVNNEKLIILLERLLFMPVEHDYRIEHKSLGLMQGSPLSPLLSDLFLIDFDSYVTSEFTNLYFRFSDDMALFFKTREEAADCYEKCVEMLKNKFNLNISERKSGVFPIMSRSYLGYTIVESAAGNSFEIIRLDKDHKVYYNWHRSGLKQYRSEVDILSNGILTYKDLTLLFEGDDKKVRIPIETVRNINVFSDVSINGTVLKYISQRKITLSVFDSYGRIIGRWVPENCNTRADVFLAQVSLYNDTEQRMVLAKAFADGELYNLKSNLTYYRKHSDADVILKSIDIISNCIEEVKKTSDYHELLLIEARAREKYYGCFNAIIPAEDFEFVKRTRRPPEDAINALISFGNVVMYNYISNEICKTALDVKVGFLHATNKRAESLNLDIAEIFKPVIIDRVIFTLINKKMINESIHFEYDEKSVKLSAEGKRIFLTNYYKRMDSEIDYKGKRMSFRRIIWEEVISVMKHIQGDSIYKPFHYRV